MLIDRKNLVRHRHWIVFSIVSLAGMTAWFLLAARAAGEWPSGSSLVGFTYGVLGGLIILFECALWFRKRYLRRGTSAGRKHGCGPTCGSGSSSCRSSSCTAACAGAAR